MKTDILNEDEVTFFSKQGFLNVGSIVLAVLVLTMLTLPESIRAEDVKKTDSAQKIYSKKEAYQASGEWDLKTFEVKNPKIVLHYGEGIMDADLLAEVLIERGYPAVAFPGGPEGLIEVIIGTISVETYDQRQLDRGTVGGTALRIFDARYGKPVKPLKPTSVTAHN